MKKSINKSFGQRVQEKRLKLKLTGNALAEKMDSSPNYMSQIENGYRLPSISYLLKLANILNCGLDELFCDELKAAQPVVLNEITKELQGLSSKQVNEIHVVVRAMLSYMK